jgi:hypothetical protein
VCMCKLLTGPRLRFCFFFVSCLQWQR